MVAKICHPLEIKTLLLLLYDYVLFISRICNND